ncbi:glucose-1-phosphate thymidylyltransferase [Niabella ginsenosidivorans]|uniref:Glucose-1-phosphate thymidylyltransferase n=1 Tax=Niabella ginsenosidivorans TaxID=1176587 RepID=A0A1A9I4S6_9BACT|nr:sugar phosphate nucleotidyltransferase [Niabella ginsenosidivorans]ANH82325.1 glucose-1-phosphate thymidylyltransferase [Niabella ginsenosidivorans]
MKAIIPVAGAGTKLRPQSYTQPKALIPLAGKTVLSFIIDQLKAAGIEEFVFIVGYLGEKIADYVKEHHPDIKAHYVNQQERRGIGHAINLTKSIIENDEVFISLGDTICEYDVTAVLNNEHSMIGIRKVDNPRDFGVAEIDEKGFIESVVEKPHIPKSNMAMVGIYKIKESELLFDCLATNIRKGLLTHGEFTITDALDCMIRNGVQFEAFKVDNWFDAGNKETLLRSNATLLRKYRVTADAAQYENSVIVAPVSIAKGCVIRNSIVGPNVTLGENTLIDQSIVRNSIVGAYSNLFDIVLEDSLIGSDTSLKGETRTLNIGDNSSIDLG